MYHFTYLAYLKVKLSGQFDVIYRDLETPKGKITLLFLESMTDSDAISHYIISPLQILTDDMDHAEDIKRRILQAAGAATIFSPDEAINHILSGNVVILFEFLKTPLACDMKKLSKRAIQKSTTDVVSQGSQEGFNEALMDNICLLRRRIKSPHLKLERFYVGRISHTPVILAYIEGLAPKALVGRMKRKLAAMDLDFILDISYLAEQIKTRFSPFDTTFSSEKPDAVAARLFEGRVAIFADGTSFVLTAPAFLTEFFQAPDDYYLNKYTSNFARLLRYISFLVSLLLPGFYVALTINHSSLIPTTIAFRIATSRASVPFPIAIETLLMLMFFEFTKKAGKRLPSHIGQPLSIVAALILGQAAINAGLTSDSTVVIVGVHAITSFINPKVSSGAFLWVLLLVLLSALLGLHGFFCGLVLFVAHLASLTSCGYPFLFPFGTARKYFAQDFLLRSSLGKMSSDLLKKGDVQ
jgi:hypothetical protein